MNEIFQKCVNLLKSIAFTLSVTYEEANVWIFIVIHPIVTLITTTMAIKYYLKSKK